LAQVSPTEFAGELLIEYMCQDNVFTMKSVAFNEAKN
jgi:hypothetical protein